MSWNVVFSPEARDKLAELYRYIAEASSPAAAAAYTTAPSLTTAKACEPFRTEAPDAITFAQLTRDGRPRAPSGNDVGVFPPPLPIAPVLLIPFGTSAQIASQGAYDNFVECNTFAGCA